MEMLTLINGNDQQYTLPLPKLVISGTEWNDTAIKHVYENTGLLFRSTHRQSMEAQPHSSDQIVRLFLTYNFKTQFHNNLDSRNTLYLKPDHHVGFSVESICYDCCKKNNIPVSGLKQGDRLAC